MVVDFRGGGCGRCINKLAPVKILLLLLLLLLLPLLLQSNLVLLQIRFVGREDMVFPDRTKYVNMKCHFMQSYMRLLVDTCHKRGAMATTGMAALVMDPAWNPTTIQVSHDDDDGTDERIMVVVMMMVVLMSV